MAKKNKPNRPPVRPGISKPESFTHGMISDLDPHFQLEGSYSDAQNIRLTNSEGDTFTVENIEGNSLFVDLSNYPKSIPTDQGTDNDYPTFYDRGPNATITNNQELSQRCSIVGHVSYANQLLLVIVGVFEYTNIKTTIVSEQKNRTIFLLIDFDHEMRVQKVTDLRVCYNAQGSDGNYPDLNMDLDMPIKIEHIVENESISRVYWTDNKNPLRTFNIKQRRLDNIQPTSLDITPLMNASQPVLGLTLFGSLPVGVYQYSYKYISENGGESTFSPLSNMYHVSDQSFSNSQTYAGGPKGNLGTQGFQINVEDIDQNFAYIELYSLFYDDLENAPRVAVVGRNTISGATSTFQHTVWNNEVDNGLEEILIESNTFDVCKDIAIKDNILFAANLRQKRNFISEKEWNVKVMRWRIQPGNTTNRLDAMLTTDDKEIKHYDGGVEITDYTINNYGHSCGHGQLLGAPGSMYESTSTAYTYMQYNGTLNVPMWTTALANQRLSAGAVGTNRNNYPHLFTYRFLPDRATLGAESFNYTQNTLGGCRITFGVEEKVADISQNAYNAPFISSTSNGEQLNTEFPTGNTVFKTSMNLGGSKDPHLAGDRRGYQRGDIYRFGVQIFDLNGAPGNVLWIGDIETPHQHDVLRMINFKNKSEVANTINYSPNLPTLTTSGLTGTRNIISHKKIQDHRLSFVYGHTVPPVSVEWFNDRKNGTNTNADAYVGFDGRTLTLNYNPAGNDSNIKFFDKLIKATPADYDYYFAAQPWSGDFLNHFTVANNHDDTHHLFDMYVYFEFMIPSDVCDKISGFRVVRAKRTEEDRRIVQQGLLNQTAQYGNAQLGQKYGYDNTAFSQKDNEMFDDDPVFVNQSLSAGATRTLPEQPEYNVYLNGYLGLAENSHLCFFNDTISDGKATVGGNLGGKTFFWPEREDVRKHVDSNLRRNARLRNNTPRGGPGTAGRHRRHTAHFGSYDKRAKYEFSQSNLGSQSNYSVNHSQISGSVFTLDAPDSAFGIRPYVYREGDMLRIDCTMKLTNEVRYLNDPNPNDNLQQRSYMSYVHGVGNIKSQASTNQVQNQTGDWDNGGSTDGNQLWEPQDHTETRFNSLQFSTEKEVDEYYKVLIGKYYCYEPYFGIGMELEGGESFGNVNEGLSSPYWQQPRRAYGWQLPIANAKEITDGEIIPSGFFSISTRITQGYVNGFSNNTLGFVKGARYTEPGGGVDSRFQKRYWVFGSVNKKVAHIFDVNSSGEILTTQDPLKEDYNYDTVSTMQMGLRSIIIEINNRASEARKYGPNPTDSYFVNQAYQNMDSWFAPLNISALFEHSRWRGENANGGYIGSPAYRNPIWSGYLTDKQHGGNWHSGHGNETHDQGQHDFNVEGKSYVPFKHLCSIIRQITPYGGYNKSSIEKTRYIPCGNFHPVGPGTGTRQGHGSQVFGGDTFVNLYSHQKTSSPYMKHSASRFQVFPVESYVNTDMRSGLTLNSGDTVVGKSMNEPPFSNDWLYNSVYSQENTVKSGIMIDEERIDDSLNLPYEIAYSNTKILGQKSDAFRQFPINQFHDMEGLYGEINSIVNFKNELYVLQDHAFAKLLVNPLSMLSDDAGTSLFTGTGETVENHIYISTKYGSNQRFSVTMSEKSLYFVDTNYGRLFKYDTEKLISLGDAFGQRNYLKYIMKDWEHRSSRICPSTSGGGPSLFGASTAHSSGTSVHGPLTGKLDSFEKKTQSRNYLADNPLKFLGVTSIYDYKNKELMVTFHNSAWLQPFNQRRIFARKSDNHFVESTVNGEPATISQTLVYSEAINSFTSRYTVTPPQWLAGGKGSFILCPENQATVNELNNVGKNNDSFTLGYPHRPYHIHKSIDSQFIQDLRINPLKLWLWDYHGQQNKTHFFGANRSNIRRLPVTDFNGNSTVQKAVAQGDLDVQPFADEAYIEKVINSEAANSKVFDNAKIVMTPKHVDFSFIDYTTDITHDTIKATSNLDEKTELLDETEQLIINRRYEFNSTLHGFGAVDSGTALTATSMLGVNSMTLPSSGGTSQLFTPNGARAINLPGKYNNIVRMKLKRNSGSGWLGKVQFIGYDPVRSKRGDYLRANFHSSREATIPEPEGIDNDFVIAEWDMSEVGGLSTNPASGAKNHSGPFGATDGADYKDCIIMMLKFMLVTGTAVFEIEWIEIGGLKADKYIDGTLRLPLRTEKSTKRTRGTYAKIKYTARTTEKFNIFAILAKYRKTL